MRTLNIRGKRRNNQSVEYLIAKGVPQGDAQRLAKHGIAKGVNPAHKVKKRPKVGFLDRDSGEFYY